MYRMPLQTIGLHRDGARVNAYPGKAFNFTAEEVAELEKIPGTIRKLHDESSGLYLASDAGPVDESALDAAREGAEGGLTPAARDPNLKPGKIKVADKAEVKSADEADGL